MENENQELGEKELEVAEPIEEVVEITEGQEGVGETEENADFTDTSTDTSELNTEDEEEQNQTTEQNAGFAAARRRAEIESQEKIRLTEEEAFKRGRFEAFKGKINPYTGQVIQDIQDVEMYETMYNMDQKGVDPTKPENLVTEFANMGRQKELEQQQKAEQQKKAEQEISEFVQKYPSVKVEELLEDKHFSAFAKGKLGDKTITEIYDNYQEFIQEIKKDERKTAINIAKQTIANANSSPGSLSNGAADEVNYENMSKEDFEKEVEKVKNRE